MIKHGHSRLFNHTTWVSAAMSCGAIAPQTCFPWQRDTATAVVVVRLGEPADRTWAALIRLDKRPAPRATT